MLRVDAHGILMAWNVARGAVRRRCLASYASSTARTAAAYCSSPFSARSRRKALSRQRCHGLTSRYNLTARCAKLAEIGAVGGEDIVPFLPRKCG